MSLDRSLPEGWAFLDAAEAPERAARATLRRILGTNADCDFCRAHGIDARTSFDAYAQSVPIRRYDELRPFIDRMVRGEAGVLVSEPVRSFHETSGTTGAPKLVPATRSSMGSVRALSALWLAATWRDVPASARARTLVIGTPARTRALESGITVGSVAGLVPNGDPDGRVTGPNAFADSPDVASRWSRTLAYALELDLSMIVAAGSPSLIVAFFDALAEARPGVAPREAWPRLAQLGCFRDGPSTSWLERLDAGSCRLPVREVGLVASEGYLSVGVGSEPSGAALAVGHHVLELCPEELGDPCAVAPSALLAPWQASVGSRYRLVVTTSSGLYRYDTEDVVEVVDWLARTPVVAFSHRAGSVVSMAGEKVTESHVVAAVAIAARETGVVVLDFVAEAEWSDAPLPRYRFDVVVSHDAPTREARSGTDVLAAALDRALGAQSTLYRDRRVRGQLGPVLVVRSDAVVAPRAGIEPAKRLHLRITTREDRRSRSPT